jgi:hypothetical protein
MPPGITCGTCGARWTGQRVSHCGGCHITTSGISAFDAHQTIHGCRNPADVGLVPVVKEWGTLWTQPVREGADREWWKKRRADGSSA